VPGPIVRVGQSMVLPGIAFQLTSGEPQPDTVTGAVGWVGQANRGPLGTPTWIYGMDQLDRIYGKTGEAGNTMDGVLEIFKGGAVAVPVVRVGTPGAPAVAATFSLIDDSAGAGVAILRVDAISPGTGGNAIAVAVRVNALDATKKDLVVYDGGQQREVHTYTPGADGAAAAVAQLAIDGSDYIAVTRLALGSGALKVVAATSLAGGANPVVTNSDYANAIALVGRQQVRLIAIDSESAAVHLIARAGVDDLIMKGRRRVLVVGQPTTVAWATRIINCRAVADPAMVFCGGGFDYQDTQGKWVTVEGYRAAARHAGGLSILPLGKQMTLRTEANAQRLRENGLPNVGPDDSQAPDAVNSGMVVWNQSDTGRISVLEGSTTYKVGDPAPIWADAVDPGWAKSRLVLTRFRLLDDIYNAWEPMIPDTSNNDAGRESLIREGKNVIDTKYIPRGAVGAYALYVATDPAPAGDSATFNLDVSTPDGLERIRLVAKFRR